MSVCETSSAETAYSTGVSASSTIRGTVALSTVLSLASYQPVLVRLRLVMLRHGVVISRSCDNGEVPGSRTRLRRFDTITTKTPPSGIQRSDCRCLLASDSKSDHPLVMYRGHRRESDAWPPPRCSPPPAHVRQAAGQGCREGPGGAASMRPDRRQRSATSVSDSRSRICTDIQNHIRSIRGNHRDSSTRSSLFRSRLGRHGAGALGRAARLAADIAGRTSRPAAASGIPGTSC